MPTNKALGQHWLKDRAMLAAIAEAAEIEPIDMILEIGPGLGTLTSELLRRAARVTAVEFDAELARKLPGQFPGKDLTVVSQDILLYDLKPLPIDYKAVANVPYYITSKIINKLLSSSNPPKTSVLLVQKEVAERVVARPGKMSLLALNAQIYATASLGAIVPRAYFTPPPEVDSQVVVLKRRDQPLVQAAEIDDFWRLAHAGFAQRRKKLHSSLSAGLHLQKESAQALLAAAEIDSNLRAQDLAIADWLALVKSYRAL